MSVFLHDKFGYRREDMVILTDDQKNPMSIPTKANIFRAMQWLVRDAQPNDSLFIHFSGESAYTPYIIRIGMCGGDARMLIDRSWRANTGFGR